MRLSSQLGDGWFQAGLAGSVFFNPERAPSPLAIATAFAVLLVPYSILGPFVGVVLDRWSRRQVLFGANALRAALVIPAALFVWYGREGPAFVVTALAIIALNRFFLSGVSASIPHVADDPRLVTANSFATTFGTVMFTAGLGTAALAFQVIGTGFHSYGTVAACAIAGYGLSAALTLTSFRRDALGPDDEEHHGSLTAVLDGAARGMVAGVRHLVARPAAASALLTHAVSRGYYGILAIGTLLLYRSYYNQGDDVIGSLVGLGTIVAAVGLGAVAASLLTPPLARRFGGWRWVAGVLGLLAVLVPSLGLAYLAPLTVAGALFVSLATQATKIVSDTALQVECDDEFRGRVFSVNDTAFNLCFVSGLFLGSLALPSDGHAPWLVLVVGAGYGLLAIWYWMVGGRHRARAV